MKPLVYCLLLILIFSTNAVFAPRPLVFEREEKNDWSALFPEFPGCERRIEPLSRNGAVYEQAAVYRRRGNSDDNAPVYIQCGTVGLRSAPDARTEAKKRFANQDEMPFFQKLAIRTFDAYSSSPLCGNDESLGSISVYFDEDKVLTVSAQRGGGNILGYAETADYAFLKKTLDEFFERPEKK